MITFIKSYNLDMIKKKFILLYLFNVTDMLFTVMLLRTGYFTEVNVLMVKALQNPFASVLLKVILPAVLLYLIYKEIRDADEIQLKAANIAVNISLTIYALVNISHLVWTGLLPIFIMKYQ